MVAQEQKKLLAKPSKNTRHYTWVSSILISQGARHKSHRVLDSLFFALNLKV